MTRMLSAVGVPVDSTITDGFGHRTHGVDPDTGDQVELLELSAALIEQPGFVTALAERVARFATVRHASYAHLRRLDRPAADRLVLVSDSTPGWRLSELLDNASRDEAPLDITVVIGVLRQLLPAVALYGRHNRDCAIGALAPERLIVTPQARLVIAEHAFGPALETLNLGRDRLWRDLRVAMPPSAGLPRANARADANALGVVALSLLIGRMLREDEYPGQLQSLLEGASERHDGQGVPLSPALVTWLGRALQLDVRAAFQSTHEAQVAFEAVLASDRGYVTSPAALEEWVARFGGSIEVAQKAESALTLEPPGEQQPDLTVTDTGRGGGILERSRGALSPLVWALLAVAAFQSIAVIWLWNREPGATRAGEGELVVQSRPISARVSVDGQERGVSPITLTLPAGAHVLEVQIGKSEPRVIPLTIQSGVQTAQYIELQNVPTTGGLDIRTDPPGARISIDGQNRGTAPVTIRDLPPGDHDVVLEANGRTVRQAVRIDAGATAQLVVPMPRR